MNFKQNFDSRYKQGGALFGDEPMPLVVKATEILLKQSNDDKAGQKPSGVEHLSALDLGVGDGRNALYLLKQGISVTGVDMSTEALKVLSQKATEYKDRLTLVESDVTKFEFTTQYDMILGLGLLHFLEYDQITKLIKQVQAHTKQSGLNVFAAKMTQNPRGSLPYVFKSGVLKSFYETDGWEILHYTETQRADIIARKL